MKIDLEDVIDQVLIDEEDVYKRQVFDRLDKLNIKYDMVEHPPAETTEEADKYIEGKEGARTKNLFLANRKNRQYYLIVMDLSLIHI